MRNIICLLIVILSVSGCGTAQPNLTSGVVLGWHNHLYRIVKAISSSNVGKELGKVSYHGKVSGAFTVFELKGSDFIRSIVFESSNGQYFQADVETNNSQ